MRRIILSLGLVALVTLSARQLASVPSESDQSKIIEFETMVGVSGPFVTPRGQPGNPIQGVSGAGAPWTISSAHGELGADGTLEVQVRGLVLAATGRNPVANFRALVSCRSIDSKGNPTTLTRSTDNFPATIPDGDADIEATIDLPRPCFAPIIFVTSPGGMWFAVTGR